MIIVSEVRTIWSESFGMKKHLLHHPSCRERTHEALIDNGY